MTFSCPHMDMAKEYCRRLKCTCVPGRRGCVLCGKVTFAIPAEERIAMLEKRAGEDRGQKTVTSDQTSEIRNQRTASGLPSSPTRAQPVLTDLWNVCAESR